MCFTAIWLGGGLFHNFFLRSLTDRKWEIEGKNAPNPKFKLLLKK